MTQIDQFESVFRAAAREVFHYQPPEIASLLVVSDLKESEASALEEQIRHFLRCLGQPQEINWQRIADETPISTAALLDRVASIQPQLIVTYRNLYSEAWRDPHSLGEHLDVLAQKITTPILVIPHPQASYAVEHALEGTNAVMAITDHLAADHLLVNYAVRFTASEGDLYLSHIEDDAAFERTMEAISRIPSIDTLDARSKIAAQLLKAPHDYIGSCREVLSAAGAPLKIHDIVTFGHRINEYRKYIDKRRIDLLVMRCKDGDQLAMHGLAYPLAVELRQIPLLLL